MTEQDQQSQTDAASVTDQVNVELKGPGPEWTEDNSILDNPDPLGIANHGLGIGEVRNEGTDEEVKGPGPEWSHLYDGQGQGGN